MNGRWTEGVRRAVLPNGLTVLVQPVPGATAVASVCHVKAGFFDEPDRLAGVSHVLEHMLFKGTPTRGVGAIAREMKAAGGYLNAGTGYDHTTYYAALPPESLPVALDLHADALRRSLIDEEELRRELVVIIEEAKRKLDTPAAVAGETLHALLFDRHRIRRWRIGTEAQLASLSQADVLGYYRSRYVPSRTIVALAGALDPDRALAAATEAFEGWEPAEPTYDPSPEEPPRYEVRARTLRGDVRRADLSLGWRTVPALHPDAAALDVATLILGSGRASWLYQELRAPGIVSSIAAGHFTPTEVGVFSFAAELDPVSLVAALHGMGGCVARLREATDEVDLTRARTLLEARWARRLQAAEGRAGALAVAEALGGAELLDVEYARLLAVGAEEVRRVAAEYLRADSMAAVALLPEGAGATQELTAELLHGAIARAGSRTARVPEPTAPAIPRPIPAKGESVGSVLHVPLPSADLLLSRKTGVPLVSLAVYRRRTVADSFKTAGLGELAVRSAVRGAGGMDSSALALAFERLGGSVVPLVSADWFGFGASVLAERAAEAAVLLDLVLRAPAFDSREIARERTTLTDEAIQAADDMMHYPIQLAFHAAFGNQRYGLPAHGFPESVPALSDGMVRAWHACELATGRTVFVAVGELEPARFAEQLAGVLGAGLPRASADLAVASWQPAVDRRQAVVEREKRQTALAMLFPGPSRSDPTRFAAEVWCAIASGLGGKLFMALRDRRSLAYTVFASSWQRAGAGAILLYLATSPGREEAAREALLEELAHFGAQPPAPEDLARAVNYLSGQVAVQRQTAGAIAGQIAEVWLSGTGLAELIDPAAAYRAVSGESVRGLAEECLASARRVEGIVRGR